MNHNRMYTTASEHFNDNPEPWQMALTNALNRFREEQKRANTRAMMRVAAAGNLGRETETPASPATTAQDIQMSRNPVESLAEFLNFASLMGAKVADVNSATFPHHAASELRIKRDQISPRRNYETAERLTPLLQSLCELYPADRIIIEANRTFSGEHAADKADTNYVRFTYVDDAGQPRFAIADNPEINNALYIWRPDVSSVELDEAFAHTRAHAKSVRCIDVRHPSYNTTDLSQFYREKVIGLLTATPANLERTK